MLNFVNLFVFYFVLLVVTLRVSVKFLPENFHKPKLVLKLFLSFGQSEIRCSYKKSAFSSSLCH